jgi:predicted homoserine dehydrogenase-like protein
VWGHYGFSEEMVADGEFNPRMFNSFLDGTKSAIEMAAVANATGLAPQADGLGFPPCGVDDLAVVCRPRADGGRLQRRGTVEVVSSLESDGRPVERDLRWGVYVTFDGGSEYVRRCFREYGVVTDPSGRYAALYRPYHFIGLELGISVASAGLLGEPTGCAREFAGDAVAVAKRELRAGETLDGEGGYCVFGRLLPAQDSIARGLLPIGLSNGVRLRRGVRTGETLRLSDVNIDETTQAAMLRKELQPTGDDRAPAGSA